MSGGLGDRRQLTVLFADVARSMELAERLDPEDLHPIMDRFFAIAAQEVQRFGGTVHQYTGDGVMAVFGAPVAHEDHAVRACQAALALREQVRGYAAELRARLRLPFSARIGINSGEAVVALAGGAAHSEPTAQGHPVGLAARIEKIARPGSVYLSQHTASLVSHAADLRDRGAFELRGVRTPIRVFELRGIDVHAEHRPVSRGRGLSRFVGRQSQQRELRRAATAAAAGRGSVVAVVGEAGIGKSRLCLEFASRCRRRGMRVHATHCTSQGKAVPLLPIVKLLRDWFELRGGDDAPAARARIVAAFPPLEASHRAMLPTLFDFLGVGDTEQLSPSSAPEARQRQIAELLALLVRGKSAGPPVLIVFDDVHWIDPASDDLLSALVAAVPGTRTLLLVNYRPEYRAAWAAAPQCQTLPLGALDKAVSQKLLQHLLGSDPSVTRLQGRIVAQTRGNPFFIEEIVRSLVAGGAVVGSRGRRRLARPIGQIAMPASLQAVVGARIDQLPPGQKALLRIASVIGRRFDRVLLEAVAGWPRAELEAALGGLVQAELVAESSERAGVEHEFQHPLLHEAAYRSQLAAQRVRLHGVVAAAMTALYGDRLDECAGLVADHYERARDLPNAVRWYARAADWTKIVHARSCLEYWRKVRELLPVVPDTETDAALGMKARVQLMNLGWRLGLPEKEAEALLSEGRRIAARWGDVRSLAMIANHYVANIQTSLGRSPARAARLLERAREASRLAESIDDPGVKLAVSVNRLYSLYLAGRLREAFTLVEQTLEKPADDHRLGAEMFGFSPILWIRSLRGQLASTMGRPLEAEDDLRRAVALATELGETENLGWAEDFYVTQAWGAGDGASAAAHAANAVAIADATGSGFSRVLAYKALGVASCLNGEWRAAIDALERAIAIGREERANRFEEPSILAWLAEAHLGVGDPESAALRSAEAVAIGRRLNARLYECEAQLARAHAWVVRDGARARSAATRALARAAELLEQTGAETHRPFLHERRAALARALGDEDLAAVETLAARRLFEAMGALGHAARLSG